MIIAIDFDGTIVEHMYPEIGNFVPGSVNAMKQLQHEGHKLILYTMRHDQELQDAIAVCETVGVKFWAVNDNPEQSEWTDSRKVYANVYIDDAAVGSAKRSGIQGQKEMIDWKKIMELLNG